MKHLFFREEKGGRKMERNISVWLPLTCPSPGDLTYNPGMCPDWESNWHPFGSQASAQSTEPHQSGQKFCGFFFFFLSFPSLFLSLHLFIPNSQHKMPLSFSCLPFLPNHCCFRTPLIIMGSVGRESLDNNFLRKVILGKNPHPLDDFNDCR